jgi:hypothetical protein
LDGTVAGGKVVCCFCGTSLDEQHAVLLVLYPTKERDETQQLYADRACLRVYGHGYEPKSFSVRP